MWADVEKSYNLYLQVYSPGVPVSTAPLSGVSSSLSSGSGGKIAGSLRRSSSVTARASSWLRITNGLIRTNNSVRVLELSVDLKRFPRMGISRAFSQPTYAS